MAYDKEKIEKEIGYFLKEYRRKRGCDPNDRHYSRKLEDIIKRMDPEELSLIMHGDDDSSD